VLNVPKVPGVLVPGVPKVLRVHSHGDK